MTACVAERRTALAITADGSYAARLTLPAASPGADGGARRAEDGGGGGGGGGCGGSGGGGARVDDGGVRDIAYGEGGGQQGDGSGDAWFPERWTLDGPEPYAVPLPLDQPEEPDTDVLPLADGRVLVRRRVADRHDFCLLYPTGRATGHPAAGNGSGTGYGYGYEAGDGGTAGYGGGQRAGLGARGRPAGPAHGRPAGPGHPTWRSPAGRAGGPVTGQLPVGGVACEELDLLPPSPDGRRAYALTYGPHSTTVWLIAGASSGPERIAEVRGRCSGGVWLDRTGRMLALDRRSDDGVVKAVAVDLARGGEVTPLLQITDESNDRLLLADPDSGLLLIRSDAPGREWLGWGVLGSSLPVRFPECLRPADGRTVTPFAVQPGQALTPEGCAVALRIDGGGGSWIGVWRPAGRRLHELPAPEGWLAGAGLWTRDGVLRLPYATGAVPCGMSYLTVPSDPLGGGPAPKRARKPEPEPESEPAPGPGPGPEEESGPSATPAPPAHRPAHRPVPLQQAPLIGRRPPG
ncbi:hypothetical protein ACWEJP_15295 [Streptomyces sp. NPDC004749]